MDVMGVVCTGEDDFRGCSVQFIILNRYISHINSLYVSATDLPKMAGRPVFIGFSAHL